MKTAMRFSSLLLLLLAAALPLAQAAELVVRDGHFAVEMLPTDFDYELKSATSSGSSSDAFEQNIGIAAGVLYSFSGPGDVTGFIVGGEIAASQASYQSIGHLTSLSGRLQGGYAWAITDSWMVRGMAEVGYGFSTLDLTANSAFPAVSADGSLLGYGARVGIQYSFNDLLHVGLDVGWLDITHELSGDGVDLTLTNSGLVVGLGISYRLSNSPRPLE